VQALIALPFERIHRAGSMSGRLSSDMESDGVSIEAFGDGGPSWGSFLSPRGGTASCAIPNSLGAFPEPGPVKRKRTWNLEEEQFNPCFQVVC
jgi:hypothetical protein